MNVDKLGQVFTPEEIVNYMVSLIKNVKGRKLEPSCGDGAFLDKIKNYKAIEIDKSVAHSKATIMDFFDLPLNEKYDCIIGNPPYVPYKSIYDTTKNKLPMEILDKRSNLYMFFIYKSILHLKDGGELIFITPRDFLKLTSASRLNKFIYENGTITHIVDLGDKSIFDGYMPNCIIFRFEKNNFNRMIENNLYFKEVNGQLLFTKSNNLIKFSDLFYVKIGAASGADKIFESPNGNKEFVYSKTMQNGKTKRMIYNVKSDELLKYKNELKLRKIKKFNEKNWWKWGRNLYNSDNPRIYVNFMTRRENPFFIHECKNYNGSILGIFIKDKKNFNNIVEIKDMLNKVDWKDLGFLCENRFIFSQTSLQNTTLPDDFKKFL